jgi:alkylated DNA repair dioxygenase AlkB
MAAPVLYLPDLAASVGDPDAMFDALLADLDWESRENTPRDEFYANDHQVPYTYGTPPHDRTYWPRPWHPVMLDLRSKLEERLECVLDVCFGNLYRDARQHLGWHADDSPEMDPDRPIVTVSFGAVRRIDFREKPGLFTKGSVIPVERLELGHGSAAVMARGMQRGWQHRIPKSDRQVGPRISLTYRGYRPV